MGYPTPPPNWPPPNWGPPPPPPRNTADSVISIIVLIAMLLVGAAGAFMALMSLAFLDYCPPESCSVNGAVTAALATVGIAALVGLAGLILTVIRLGKRKLAWPFAVGSLALVIAVFFLGGLAYTTVVNY